MSSYTTKARNKETGEIVTVHCLDNFWGRHKYGYRLDGVGNETMDERGFFSRYEFIKEAK